MYKFTPGPWFITGNMTRYIEARIGGGLIQEVAACGPTEADNGYGEQQMANARLIAAAPELLEALEYMLETNESGDNAGDQARAQARAAIAKARGES